MAIQQWHVREISFNFEMKESQDRVIKSLKLRKRKQTLFFGNVCKDARKFTGESFICENYIIYYIHFPFREFFAFWQATCYSCRVVVIVL